eukprot:3318213-Amphidinium_carterae.1
MVVQATAQTPYTTRPTNLNYKQTTAIGKCRNLNSLSSKRYLGYIFVGPREWTSRKTQCKSATANAHHNLSKLAAAIMSNGAVDAVQQARASLYDCSMCARTMKKNKVAVKFHDDYRYARATKCNRSSNDFKHSERNL